MSKGVICFLEGGPDMGIYLSSSFPSSRLSFLPASLTKQCCLLAWQEANGEGEGEEEEEEEEEEEGNRSVLSKVNSVV